MALELVKRAEAGTGRSRERQQGRAGQGDRAEVLELVKRAGAAF